MIFVTVGTQLTFDRMLQIVDQWAVQSEKSVFCQTGPTELTLDSVATKPFLSPVEYHEQMVRSSVIVSHAGIGSILSAMEYKKPIIIFPRRASLGEHRNEHQLATAKSFEGKPGIYVAYNEDELFGLLNSLVELDNKSVFEPFADQSLLDSVRDFIWK